jgi:hypothetical protein
MKGLYGVVAVEATAGLEPRSQDREAMGWWLIYRDPMAVRDYAADLTGTDAFDASR